MQPDNLESFIKQNRAEFDIKTPEAEIWNRIEKQMDGRSVRKLKVRRSLSMAAGIAALLSAGFLLGNYSSGLSVQNDSQARVEEIVPELPKLEKFYDQEFQRKYQQLVSYDYDNGVNDDLAEIDQAMSELKLELLNAPKGLEKEILQNLIDSYKMKIKILERVLEQFQGADQPNNSSEHERFTI